MIQLFEGCEDNALTVSVLAAVEVRSAVRRRETYGDLSGEDASQVIRGLLQETGRMVEMPMTAVVIAEANSVVDRHPLRALDAIQLASALVARDSLAPGQSLHFAASDRRLLEAAEKEKFTTWNPESQALPPTSA